MLDLTKKRISLLAIFCLCLVFLWVDIRSQRNEHKIVDLQNQLAQATKTVEIQTGLYRKAATESDNLNLLLGQKDDAIEALAQQLNRTREQLLSVSQLSFRLKHDYESTVKGQQSEVAPSSPGSPVRKRVDFRDHLGRFDVSGYTLTDPAEAHLTLHQERPLLLTLAVAQARDGSWAAYATSDDPDVGVDVKVAAVNPRVLAPRWYERLSVGGLMTWSYPKTGTLSANLTVSLGSCFVGPGVGMLFGPSSGPFFGASGGCFWKMFGRR